MYTNKILDILLSATAFIIIPIQIVTTFVLGVLVNLTFGLLLIPISLIWIIFFLGPLIGLSYLWERIAFLRPVISIVGVPLALVGDTYVALTPSMGEFNSRFSKMLVCQTFPYSWSFWQFNNRNLEFSDDLAEKLDSIFGVGDNDFEKILIRISRVDKALHGYLDNLIKLSD